MAKISIKRAKRNFHWANDFEVFIDSKCVGTVSNGQTKEFDTTSGSHQVSLKMNRYASPTISIEVQNNQPKSLEANLHKTIYLQGMSSIPLMIGAIIVRKYDYDSIAMQVGMITPAALMFANSIYYLTKGRSRYLRLIEVK